MAVFFQAGACVCVPDSGQKGEVLWQMAKMPLVGQKYGHTVVHVSAYPQMAHLIHCI